MLGVAFEFENYPSTDTKINATNLNNMQKLLVDLIHPIGTYYETSDNNFDPNTAWGGTWELDQSGTVLVSKSNTSGSKFNDEIGTIVGEEEHTLTIDEMPSHNHNLYSYNGSGTGTINGGGGVAQDHDSPYNTWWANIAIQYAGGGQAHNNVQPSKIVNRWHRTA